VSPRTAHGVVFTFSYETWDDAVYRGMMRPPDRLAAALIADPGVCDVIIANPYRWLPTVLARRALGTGAAFPALAGRRLLQPWRLRDRRDPLDPDALEARYRAYGRALGRAARGAGMERPLLLTTHPLVAGFADTSWAARVVYFGRDDWTSYPGRSEFWPAYRDAYRRIAASGMPVAAVSAQIVERIAPTGPGVVVPNGVEVHSRLRPPGSTPSAPRVWSTWERSTNGSTPRASPPSHERGPTSRSCCSATWPHRTIFRPWRACPTWSPIRLSAGRSSSPCCATRRRPSWRIVSRR